MDADLTARILQLQPLKTCQLPLSHGRYTYGAALELLAQSSPAVAQQVHDADMHAPLTTGPVWGRAQRRQGTLLLSPTEIYRWRLTGITREVSSCLHHITPDMPPLRLGEGAFRIVGVLSEDDPDVGTTSYEALWERWWNAEPERVVTFAFVSPTTFRKGRFEQPFPSPQLLFGHLAEAWDTYSPHHKLGELRELMAEAVILSNWKGETRRVELGNRRTVGFIGRFGYRVLENLKEILRVLGLLREFAFYAGVSWQTTHGMGQTREATRMG